MLPRRIALLLLVKCTCFLTFQSQSSQIVDVIALYRTLRVEISIKKLIFVYELNLNASRVDKIFQVWLMYYFSHLVVILRD